MMIVDIRKLNVQKKYSGHMEFAYDAPESLIEIPFTKFSTPVKVEFDYELYEDDSFEIKGKISYELEGQCSRCLKDSAMKVVGELDAYFQCSKEYEDYGYTNGRVDLTDAVNDAIMTSMPFTLSCGDDCKGIDFHK